MDPVEFQSGERSASAFYYFGKNGIPKVSRKIRYIEDWDNEVNAKHVRIWRPIHCFCVC